MYSILPQHALFYTDVLINLGDLFANAEIK